jgi:FMN-dependent NADH-azoreductase
MYVAKWEDKLTGKIKYVWFSDSAFLKQNREKEKFKKAELLGKQIGKIEDHIIKNLNANDENMRNASQSHCLAEFRAIEPRLQKNTIVLIDDNMLPFGGKPKLLKEYLDQKGWVCLFDYQQTLWIRGK